MAVGIGEAFPGVFVAGPVFAPVAGVVKSGFAPPTAVVGYCPGTIVAVLPGNYPGALVGYLVLTTGVTYGTVVSSLALTAVSLTTAVVGLVPVVGTGAPFLFI